MRWALATTVALLAAVASHQGAAAQTYRFVPPDGTVHLTNAPTGPHWERVDARPVGPQIIASPPADGTPLPGYSLRRYGHEIRAAAARHNVPVKLIYAVIAAESRFNPRAISPRGARGLMQLMPATALRLGVQDPHDPRENIDAGVRHLRVLMNLFGNDVPLAVAAYNAGERAVLFYRGVPPFPETSEYVAQVLRHMRAVDDAPRSGGPAPDEASGGLSEPNLDLLPWPVVDRLLPDPIYRIRHQDATLYTNIVPPAPR